VLKMKASCERCDVALEPAGVAYICSFECTFCERCSRAMSNVCPNCGGELVRRPARVRKVSDVAVSQVRRRLGRLLGR
jgi:hypothetical protein